MERLKIDLSIEENQEVLDKMKEAYLACPSAIKYLKELGVPDETIDDNITKIFDFVRDINYCKKCPGIKNCSKPNALLTTKVTYNYGFLDVQLSPCKELLNRVTFEKQFKVRDFEDNMLDVSLKEINHNDGRKTAIKKYKEFLNLGVNGWIYLYGSPNSGRSYFAATITVDAAKRNKGPIYFLNSSRRIQELYELSKTKNSEFQEILDKYSNAPILVLDDFGNEYKNDFIRDAIVFPILSNRANKKLFTIITSDFSMQDIADLYSTNKAGSIRARQLLTILKMSSKEEINLGELEVY